MRGYSVATSALALGINGKWLDNLLSHNHVAGVTRARQGVARRLGPGALYVIATVHRLNRDLQIPVGTALRLAHDLWASPGNSDPTDIAALRFGEIELQLNRSKVRAAIAAAVAEALEVAPRTRRGRPAVKRRVEAASS